MESGDLQQSQPGYVEVKEEGKAEKQEKDISAASFLTEELTDLNNVSEMDQKDLSFLKKQHQTADENQPLNEQDSSISEIKGEQASGELQRLRSMMKDQALIMEKLQRENNSHKHKIEQLHNLASYQSQEIESLKGQLMTKTDSQPTLISPQEPELNKRGSQDNSRASQLKYTTDFWKEKDRDFYQTNQLQQQNQSQGQGKQGVPKGKAKLELLPAELWIEKQEKNYESQKFEQGSTFEGKPEVKSKILDYQTHSNKVHNVKSSTIKKAPRKVFNEDLEEYVAEKVDQKKVVSAVRAPYSNPFMKNKNNPKLEEIKEAKALMNPNLVNKLEALKFKMELQQKNLKLLKEHDLIMRDMEKKDRRRENKVQHIQSVNRLEREVEKTQKQLKQELQMALKYDSKSLEEKFLRECEALFENQAVYEKMVQQENLERKAKKDYRGVKSRINTNLKGIKHQLITADNYQHLNDNSDQDGWKRTEKDEDEEEMVRHQSREHVAGDVGSSSNPRFESEQKFALPQITKK